MNASDGACEVFNAIDKTIHARQNKIVRQGLVPENLRRFEPMWLKHAQLFVNRLAAGSCNASDTAWSVPKDVSYYGKNGLPIRCKKHSRHKAHCLDLANCVMIDIMGTYVFGREFDLQSQPRNRYMINVINTLQKWNSAHVQSPSLARLQLDKIFYPQQIYYGLKLQEEIRIIVDGRSRDINEAKNDLFSFIVDATGPDGEICLTPSEIESHAKLLMVACK